MHDTAAEFVAGWISRNITNNPAKSNHAELVARLARRLEHAAWGSGIGRDDFLMAVGGDSYEYVLSEVERGLLVTSPPSPPSLKLLGPA